jgi:hypothetical protein
MNQEKRATQVAHEEQVNKLQKQEIEKRNVLKDKVMRDVANMRETQERELVASRERSKDRFNKVVQDTDRKVMNLTEASDKRQKDLVEAQQKEIKNQNLAFRDKFVAQEKAYNKDVRDLEFANKRNGIGVGSTNYENQQQLNKIADENRDKHVRRIFRERNQLAEEYAKSSQKAQQEFNDTYENIKIANAHDREVLKNNLNQANLKERTQERIDKARINEEHQTAINYERNVGQSKANKEQQEAKEKITSLKEQFKESMDRANENSKKSFAAVREEMNREKATLQKRIHEQNSVANEARKEQNDAKMAKMREGYEKRISALEIQNKEIKQSLQNKIQEVMNTSTAEIQRQQRAFKETANNEIKLERAAAKSKQEQLRLSMVEMQKNFDSKLNELRLNADKMNKQLTFDYENKLKDQQEKFQKIIDQNKRFSEREQARLNAASEDQKQRLVTQYEDKIRKLQDVNRAKIQEMERFASLNAQNNVS